MAAQPSRSSLRETDLTRPNSSSLSADTARFALRLRDVLDQSIEVLTGDDTVLAYDVPASTAA